MTGAGPSEHAPDLARQAFLEMRLAQHIEDAGRGGPVRQALVEISGDQDDGRTDIAIPQAGSQIKPVHAAVLAVDAGQWLSGFRDAFV